MPWPVYSTRFLGVAGVPGVTSYFVPFADRASIKSIVCANPNGSATAITLYVAQQLTYVFNFPAGTKALSLECMIVAYGGNDISIHMASADVGASVNGFLFAESAGRREEPIVKQWTLEEYEAWALREQPAPRPSS